jgi:uncharacterized protein (TIGR02466 family)
MQTEKIELYASPVFRFFWENHQDLNARLKAVVREKMRRHVGEVSSNRGGWHSKKDLQHWPDECVQEFFARVRGAIETLVRDTVPNPRPEHFENWDIQAWVNVNQKGAFNKPHHHEGYGTVWSSFYYVDTGQTRPGEDVGGHTRFQDRSRVPKDILSERDPFSREVDVTPTEGLLVLFPAGLYHYVEPYLGAAERMTIAFNLKNPAFTIPYYDGMLEQGWWRTNFRGLTILPQKLRERASAAALLPSKLVANKPASLNPAVLWEHFKAAVDHATAEASARLERNWGRILPRDDT